MMSELEIVRDLAVEQDVRAVAVIQTLTMSWLLIWWTLTLLSLGFTQVVLVLVGLLIALVVVGMLLAEGLWRFQAYAFVGQKMWAAPSLILGLLGAGNTSSWVTAALRGQHGHGDTFFLVAFAFCSWLAVTSGLTLWALLRPTCQNLFTEAYRQTMDEDRDSSLGFYRSPVFLFPITLALAGVGLCLVVWVMGPLSAHPPTVEKGRTYSDAEFQAERDFCSLAYWGSGGTTNWYFNGRGNLRVYGSGPSRLTQLPQSRIDPYTAALARSTAAFQSSGRLKPLVSEGGMASRPGEVRICFRFGGQEGTLVVDVDSESQLIQPLVNDWNRMFTDQGWPAVQLSSMGAGP